MGLYFPTLRVIAFPAQSLIASANPICLITMRTRPRSLEPEALFVFTQG